MSPRLRHPSFGNHQTFFQYRKLRFVLAIDRQQIISSICAVYGPTVDGEAYLKKFIEWHYALPPPKVENFAYYLYEAFSFEDVLVSEDDWARGSQ